MGPRTGRRGGGSQDTVSMERDFGKVKGRVLSLRRKEPGRSVGIENQLVVGKRKVETLEGTQGLGFNP